MKIRKILILFFLNILTFGVDCACANLYRVDHVPVVAERSSASEAKDAALAEGQVEAFNRLMTRLAPDNSFVLPRLSEEEVLSYVLGVSIENEKTTATKYMGNIAVEFNPASIKKLLNSEQVSYLQMAAPSILVMPEYMVGNQILPLDAHNPLLVALKGKGDFAPFYQAAVLQGTEEDAALLHQGTEGMRQLLRLYGKDKFMTLRLKQESQDMWQISSYFMPEDHMENQNVTKRFRFSSGELNSALIKMTEAVFDEMEAHWRNDRTGNANAVQGLYLRVVVDSLQEWLALEQEMKQWNLWDSITLRGVYVPQVLLEVQSQLSENEIMNRLRNFGWELEKDSVGNGAVLRKVRIHEQE